MNQNNPDIAPDVRGTDAGRHLAARLAEVSERLHRDVSEAVTFARVVEGAVEVVPGCDESGVLVRDRRGALTAVMNTSPALVSVDESQCLLAEGPLFEPDSPVMRRTEPDVSHDGRWPHWSPIAADHGIRSVLALRLRVGNEDLGALTLYGREPDVFDEEAVEVATLYAAHAAQAVHQMRTITGLRTALDSRHDIGIAQGVIAVRYDLGYDDAFSVLQRYSNESNIKLRDVARQVKDDRSLPQRPS